MPIRYVDWITRKMLRDNRGARFLFGDNAERSGFGGQAREMRGEQNAIGIATKRRPSMESGSFFDDTRLDDFETVARDLFLVDRAVFYAGMTVCVPRDGLGTGLSQLPTRAPNLYAYIVHRFRSYPGDPCPWSLP